jgi:hypothetical protein
MVMLFCAVVIAPAQERESGGSTVGGVYDPREDIINPAVSHWLYYGEVFAYAPLWSAALGMTFNPVDTKWDAAIELLGWPGTFFSFLWATHKREITLGMVSASSWGSIQGAGLGFAAGDVLYDWGQQSGTINPRFATLLAASIAGHILGFQHADRKQLNWGNAEMLAQSGLLGATYGGLLTSMAVPWSGSGWSGNGTVPWARKVVEVGAMGGWCAGVYYWNRYAPLDYTTGDAISSYDALGLSVLSGFAVSNLLPADWSLYGTNHTGQKVAAFTTGVVNAAGVAYGYYFHRNRDIGFGQSLLVTMGSVVGAVGLGGATELVTNSGKAGWLAAAVGGWAGFHLSHAMLGTAAGSQASLKRDDFLSRVQLMPGNAVALLVAAKTHTSATIPLIAARF